jgi:hypothetical protein
MKEETKQPEEKKTDESPKMRQIIIETDGNNINLVKAEVSGRIELVGILQSIIEHFNQQKQ